MDGMLDIAQPVSFSEDITRYQWHTFNPFVTSGNYGNNDEIRIAANSQDMQTHPGMSNLVIEVTITSGTTTGELQEPKTRPINNAIAHLFSEIRYELNGVEVDSVRHLGIASTLKGLISYDRLNAKALGNACWLESVNATIPVTGKFTFVLPLKHLLGFAEDYRKVITNMKQELILVRSQSDSDAFYRKEGTMDEGFSIKVEKVSWRLPIVELDDRARLRMLTILERDQPIKIPFRSWECLYYPQLPISDRQTWSVKLSSSLEKPRFVILAFQTDRRNKMHRPSSYFDHCNLRNAKLFLNGESYPYEDLNIDFQNNGHSILYEMYTQFQVSYYNKENAEPFMSLLEFKELAPIIVIDCSRQRDAVKSSSVDVRLEFSARSNFPENTSAYCLILHDRIIQYTPSDGVVRRMV